MPRDNEQYETDPLFFLRPAYWAPATASGGSSTLTRQKSTVKAMQDEGAYEPVGPELEAKLAVAIEDLRKVYGAGAGAVHALNGLAVNFYADQITAFLGHNGSGKTTCIGVLTGLFNADSGEARIHGKSVARDMKELYHVLGVCPQHDVLWPDLTVRDHLQLFAILRKGTRAGIDEEIDELIAQIGLAEKADSVSKSLSGGQKRKLSVAMALVGDPKVIFLDEPTAGMDTQTRRDVWELLARKKKGRCIVLTTHFMDEADILGDRVAVLSAGRLQAAGSSLFLKRRFGLGYHLTVALAPGADRHAVLAGVRAAGIAGAAVDVSKVVPEDATATERERVEEALLRGTGAGELELVVPLHAAPELPTALRRLDGTPGVKSYGLATPSLEEVRYFRGRRDRGRRRRLTDRPTDSTSRRSSSGCTARRRWRRRPARTGRTSTRAPPPPPPQSPRSSGRTTRSPAPWGRRRARGSASGSWSAGCWRRSAAGCGGWR